MKKSLKIVFAILILISIVFIVPTEVFADPPRSTSDNFDMSQFDTEISGASNLTTKTRSVMGTVINVVRVIGTATAIVTLTYMSIKYMMASPEGKADFKKSAYIYIVGAVLVFAASNILAIIYQFAESL